ncbi:MAG TPA: type II toxin-antitoxin system death-on-curing family toxin [Candidatus Limnocylindria bacterium]|nr:type II toxin-antitoxin system death-on-curing family toxin [Candidatus Limnocylindria bacterium]
MTTEYLDLDDAFDAYAEAVEVSVEQAKDALLNRGQLESALARPQNAAAYEDADIVRQASTLFWGVATNHPFRDGNKRTSVVVLRSFLNLNGYDMTLSEDEIFRLALGVADGHLAVDAVEVTLRPAVVPL